MKNILFLTDFSNTASNALHFAAWFAAQMKAKLTLLNVVKQKAFFTGIGQGKSDSESKANLALAEKKLTLCLDQVGNKNNSEDALSCDYRIAEGSLSDVVNHYSEHENFDLVMMGTTGVHGDTLEDLMVGSNALALFENSQVPILAIPRNYELRQLHRMVFATDYQALDQAAVSEAIKIGTVFNAHLHVLHVSKNKATDQQLIDITRPFAQQYDHLHFNSIASSNPDVELLNFAEEQAADLIVMTRKKHGFFKKIFHHSVTEQVSCQTKVPLLVFPAAWKKANN